MLKNIILVILLILLILFFVKNTSTFNNFVKFSFDTVVNTTKIIANYTTDFNNTSNSTLINNTNVNFTK